MRGTGHDPDCRLPEGFSRSREPGGAARWSEARWRENERKGVVLSYDIRSLGQVRSIISPWHLILSSQVLSSAANACRIRRECQSCGPLTPWPLTLGGFRHIDVPIKKLFYYICNYVYISLADGLRIMNTFSKQNKSAIWYGQEYFCLDDDSYVADVNHYIKHTENIDLRIPDSFFNNSFLHLYAQASVWYKCEDSLFRVLELNNRTRYLVFFTISLFSAKRVSIVFWACHRTTCDAFLGIFPPQKHVVIITEKTLTRLSN